MNKYINTKIFIYIMGNMVLRTFYDERDLQSHLLRRKSEERQIERATDQLIQNKTLFEDVKNRMDNMEKTLEILTNDSRLKDVMDREVERLNELKRNNLSRLN